MQYEMDDYNHLYMGFYHLVGEIVKKPNEDVEKWNDSNIIKIDNVNFIFSEELDLVPEKFPQPVIQLEFEVILPWLLNARCK